MNCASRPSGDAEMDKAVYKTTVEERNLGWMDKRGPFSEEQLKAMLGPLFVVNRRFGIRQGNKVRAIDNYSSSFVNLSYSTTWKLEFGSIGLIVNVAKAFSEAVSDEKWVRIILSDGMVLEGPLHPSITLEEARTLVGRTLDLSNAYRQLFNSPASNWCSVISTFNPNTGKMELNLQHANPFGATACAYAFNRFAKALWWIGVSTFFLIWTNHFDDYPQLDLGIMGNASQETAEALFDLVGWKVSYDEAKRQPFKSEFAPLGVVINLAKSGVGKMLL